MTPAVSRAAANAVAGSILAVSTAMGLYVHGHPKLARFQQGGGGIKRAVESPPPLFLSKDPNYDLNSHGHCAPTLSRHLRQRFHPGDYYIWIYRDKHGNPTSWEKYEVASVSSEEEEVTIEMATKFSADEGYFVHHRMKVNLGDHLEASKNRTDWRIGFEHCVGGGDDPDGGKWQPFGAGDNVQAFEEKFDVFSMLNLTNKYEGATRVVDFNEHKLTLTRSGRHDYTGAWYAPSTHPLSGVAVAKKFDEHSFSLIRTKRDGNEVDVRVNF